MAISIITGIIHGNVSPFITWVHNTTCGVYDNRNLTWKRQAKSSMSLFMLYGVTMRVVSYGGLFVLKQIFEWILNMLDSEV